MHTTEVNDTLFVHNGDFSGDVEVRTFEGRLSVPFADLKALVACYVRQVRANELEDMSDDEVLGIFLNLGGN